MPEHDTKRHPARGRLASAALGVLVAALVSPSAGAPPPVLDPSWDVVRTDTLIHAQAATFNPKDGRIYALRLDSELNGGGVYRIESDGALTLITASYRPRGLAIDPSTGNLFHAEGGAGILWRTPFGQLGREVWSAGWHSGDDDPIGLAIAPLDYTGSVVAPGDGLAVDEGTNGPREVWAWLPDTAGAETQVHAEDGTMEKPVDVAIGRHDVWIVDQVAGAILELAPDGSHTTLATSVPLDSMRAVAVDPVDQSILVLDEAGQQFVRVDPDTGSVSVIANNLALRGATGIGPTADGVEVLVSDHDNDAIYTFSRLPALGPGQPLGCGTSAAGDFTAAGDLQTWTFQGAANDVVGIVVVPESGAGSSPRVVLFGPDRARVALASEFAGCAGLCASAKLPLDGPYTAVLYDEAHAASGAYRVGLEALSAGLHGAANSGASPVCGAPDGVRELSCGTVAAATFDSVGDADVYTIAGEAGDVLRITTGPVGGALVSPVATLLAPDGTVVDFPIQGVPCGGVCDSDPLPVDGSYSLLVTDGLLLATGDYDVRVDEWLGGAPVCDNACSNGVDDDGDGAIDGADAGCAGPDDFSEEPACNDGVDNDGDGLIDYGADPGCSAAEVDLEDPACDDGVDQDGDGGRDWDGLDWNADGDFLDPGELPPDPQCVHPWRDRETASNCGLGAELAVVLSPLGWWARRRRRTARA